jgi:hypothetical protein
MHKNLSSSYGLWPRLSENCYMFISTKNAFNLVQDTCANLFCIKISYMIGIKRSNMIGICVGAYYLRL